MARNRRQHFCVGGWASKRDAEADAAIFTKHGGHKAVVKKSGGGFKVCYTMGAKRRKNVPKSQR